MNRLNQTYSQTNIYTQHSGADTGNPFFGKEKDFEASLSCFGARYYEPEMLNIWLSVDPMADKYPDTSPYNYCAWTRPTGGDEHRWIKYNIVNNPVKLVDPDGMEVGDYYSIYGEWLKWLTLNGSYKNTSGQFECSKNNKGIINHRFLNVK